MSIGGVYYIYIFSPKRMATYGNWSTALAETPSLRVPDMFTDFDTSHPELLMLITNDTNVWTNSESLTLLKCLLLLQTNLMGYHIRNEEWRTVLEAWCTQLPVSECLYNVDPFSSLSHKHQLFQKRPSTGMYSSDNLMIALLKDLKYYIDETMHKKHC